MHETGSISCWGENGSGRATPPSGTDFTKIASGYAHSCGLRSSGAIACWGDNSEGQATAPAGKYSSITAGGNYGCAQRVDDFFVCWGSNSESQRVVPEGVNPSQPALSGLKLGRSPITVGTASTTLLFTASKPGVRTMTLNRPGSGTRTSVGTFKAGRNSITINTSGLKVGTYKVKLTLALPTPPPSRRAASAAVVSSSTVYLVVTPKATTRR